MRLDCLAVDEHYQPTEIPRMMTDREITGLLVLGAYLSVESAQMLGQQPIVLVDGYAEEPGHMIRIVSDNVGGVATATGRLIEFGHNVIAFVGAPPDAFPSILEWRRGYEEAMAGAGLDTCYVDEHHNNPAKCAEAAADALRRSPSITAFAAANDEVALALLGSPHDRVPGEISLVGFDDIDEAKAARPRLDTVAVDKAAMGRLAATLLRHRIDHPNDPAFTVTQKASLINRDTSGPPRR